MTKEWKFYANHNNAFVSEAGGVKIICINLYIVLYNHCFPPII